MSNPILEAWRLKDLPAFQGTPSNAEELMKVFVGRRRDMEDVKYVLSTGENVLVRGTTGIGKTAFMMATLYDLTTNGDVVGHKIFPVYVRQFAGDTRDDLYRVVLYAIAKRFSSEDDRARQILCALTGMKVNAGTSGKSTFGFEVGVPGVFKVQGGGESGDNQSQTSDYQHAEHFVNELLDSITASGYKRVVIALDDVEQRTSQTDIAHLFESSLDLIRDTRIAFMLAGRRLTLQQDAILSAPGLAVYNLAITMKPMTSSELRAIAIKILNLVRLNPQKETVHPFTEESIEAIADKSEGIPRPFILLCGAIIRRAFWNGHHEINLKVFNDCFLEHQDELASLEIPPETRQALYLGMKKGGLTITDSVDMEEVLGMLGLRSLRDFVEVAEGMVQQDLLQRSLNDRGETIYKITAGVEKLAESGAKLVEPPSEAL
jgi:Cdc6-like AAA superfamily ATPase